MPCRTQVKLLHNNESNIFFVFFQSYIMQIHLAKSLPALCSILYFSLLAFQSHRRLSIDPSHIAIFWGAYPTCSLRTSKILLILKDWQQCLNKIVQIEQVRFLLIVVIVHFFQFILRSFCFYYYEKKYIYLFVTLTTYFLSATKQKSES